MSSRFWWWLRSLWHSPSQQIEMYKPSTFIHWNEYAGYYLNPQYRWQGVRFKLIKQDLEGLITRIKRQLLWIQPFRCNGNAGGWRTDFCERLENYARSKE